MKQTSNERRYIGAGRSAKVYRHSDGQRDIATKVFVGEGLSKLVLFGLTGSANPYTWCADAIESALLRRRLLKRLTQYWFSGQLYVPETYGSRWNEADRAYEIDMEFIAGQHVPLINPVDEGQEDAATRQMTEVMQPLQEHLIAAGFDGLVWQAGKGNPVALSNFMCQSQDARVEQWVWIDMESGVPAYFALNPLATLGFYLPKTFRHRGALFDDVDTEKLQTYLSEQQQELIDCFDATQYEEMQNQAEALATHQRAWKSLPRYRRSLDYAFSQGKIDEAAYERFKTRKFRWYLRSLVFLCLSAVKKSVSVLGKIYRRVWNFPLIHSWHLMWRYFLSADYRWRFICLYLRHQINKWHKRLSLSDEAKQLLIKELDQNRSSACLADFSMHLGLKPLIEGVTLLGLPFLLAAQYISIEQSVYIALFLGPAVRTLYTLFRFFMSAISGRRYYPWLALIVGTLPAIGNLAYPFELLARSSHKNNKLEQFIVYALVCKIGQKIPIWGGQDGGIEHFCNRLCLRFIR